MSSTIGVVVKALLSDHDTNKKLRQIFEKNEDRTSRASAVREYCKQMFLGNSPDLNAIQRILLDHILHTTHWGDVVSEMESSTSFVEFSNEEAPDLSIKDSSSADDSDVILL